MKKPVFQRAMFIAMAPKSESKGILSGFDEEMENEDYEDRTPENLEIIANNLRGDIRSMDERYLELAQLVGEAAFETPEEVIALMQSQMAAQQQPMSPAPAPQQAGIAALGVPPEAPPPSGGIMAGMEEPQPQTQQPQMQQPPLQMAHGGLVHMSNGGDPARFADLNARMAAAQGAPRFQWMTNALGAADDRITNFLRQQLQTGAPTSASGKPIPFVDQSGRLYQPVGGTNPNMASRGMPMPSKFNLGRFATRFGGPVGVLGGLAADTLIGSDANKGQLYGSTFGLETGEETANLVGGQPVFGNPLLEYSNIDSSTVVPEALPPPPPPGNVGGLTPAEGSKAPDERFIPKEERAPFTPVPRVSPVRQKVGEEDEKSFRDRVREKMDIYSEFLGDDAEARKAQALFLIAEAALNVANAPGRSIGERLTKGFKGLPSGLAAIGAEAQKDKRAIASAAISAVEQEYSDARKAAAAVAKASAGKGPVNDKVRSIFSSLKARNPNVDDAILLQLAIDKENGTIYVDQSTKEFYDNIDGTLRYTPHRALSPNSVGYLDPQNPYVRVSPQKLEPVIAPEQRKALLEEREKLQRNLPMYDRFLADIYGDTVGILPTIRSGVSQTTLALFGDTGFGLTNVQQNAVRQKQALANEYVTRGLFRNNSRVSNLDMTRAEDLARDPNKLAQSSQLVVTQVQNFAFQDMNRLAEIDHVLGLTPELKQIDRVPSGAKTDPLPVMRGTETILRDAFTRRPNLVMYLQFPDQKAPDGTVIKGTLEKVDKSNPYIQRLLQGAAQ